MLILTHTNEKKFPIGLFVILSSIANAEGHWEKIAQPTDKVLKRVFLLVVLPDCVLGNEIATLVNEEKSTGYYEIEFDANELTSGIYYYQLIAEDLFKQKGRCY